MTDKTSEEEQDTVILYLNENPENLECLFLNEKWDIKELYDRIYSIYVKGKKIPWLIKTYPCLKHAKYESKKLDLLKEIYGIPKILTTGLNPKLSFIVMSEQSGIDLYEHVEKNGIFPESKVKFICFKLLKILKKIHDKNIIHGDIKPENIIYDDTFKTVSLIDFEEKYTQDYTSPENIKKYKKITCKTDLWSLGITIYFLLTGRNPFKGIKNILNKKITIKGDWSDELKDFIGCLLERDVDLRYNTEDALNHIWFND